MATIRATSACLLAAAAQSFYLGLGINMGNTLEASCDGCWAPAAQQYYFSDYKAAGFNTVRIPVNWGNYMPMDTPYTINATWIARVQEVVSWCLAEDFNCIINSHWDSWLNNETEFDKMLPRFEALWTQVGAAFATAPANLLFESFNEPSNLTTVQLNQLLQTFYNATRATNPTRWLIFGWLQWMGTQWITDATSPGTANNGSNYNAMWLPEWQDDGRIAVEVHNYDPWKVCGQGTEPWGLPADVAAMAQMFANTSAWSASHGIPLFYGEWGCTRKNTSPTRYDWYAAFAQGCKASSAGCLAWDDDGANGYQIYNRTDRSWDEGILHAIGLGGGRR
jgi:endoglucanase